MRILAGFAICCLALTSCDRERRNARPAPVRTIVYDGAARESTLEPGGPKTQPAVANPYYGSAYDIYEGQRWFQWYNCSGCHANGGGGMGPPLIKQQWIYGGEPANIFDTIIKGRPTARTCSSGPAMRRRRSSGGRRRSRHLRLRPRLRRLRRLRQDSVRLLALHTAFRRIFRKKTSSTIRSGRSRRGGTRIARTARTIYGSRTAPSS